MRPFISLILPYWQRQGAADWAMQCLARQYPALNLEVIVVDDGNAEPFRVLPGLPFEVKVVTLPRKDGPLSSCAPMNRGAAIAQGRYLALSSVEILHTAPVLQAMADEIAAHGPDTYVLAACWAPESNAWHCHSTNQRGNDHDVGAWLPPGADYHFMAMLSRELWQKTGGFDEAYRDGAGYEDADFVRRLHRAGARFVIRDDLVVEHPRAGARAAWRPEQFARNRGLFLSKWGRLR